MNRQENSVGDIVTLGAEPAVTPSPEAWGDYLTNLRDSVQTSWEQARSAYFTLKSVREKLGLPFKASPTGESPAYGMSSAAAWSDDLEQNAVDIQAMVKVSVDAANDAIAGKRKLVWDDKSSEFAITALPDDVLGIRRSPSGVPELYDTKNGAQAHVTGTIGVGLPQILIGVAVGATVIQGLTIYFGVKKLCETFESVSADKTARTLMEKQVELVKSGATPAEAKAATDAVLQGSVALAKAKGEAAANKPPDELASTLKTVAYVGLGALIIYAVIRLVPPIERAPRQALAMPLLSNPRVYDNGSFYSVSVSEREIDDFADRWPASGLRGLRGVVFQYDKRNGDLVDIAYKNGDSDRWDGPALVALSEDAQKSALKKYPEWRS